MKALARSQFVAALLTALVGGCGGGGGGGPTPAGGTGTGGNGTGGTTPAGPSISYSATHFQFHADKPYSETPASGQIVATVTGVTSGTLYITVIEHDPDVVTVQNITVTSTTSGQATVVPARPGYLMAGNHQGSFVVRACLNDPTCSTGQLNGSPQTFTVDYDIGSNIDADTVTPRVVPANVAGSITLRGHGFAIGQTVSIGPTTITRESISYYSESDLGVNYPALPAGTYPITVSSGSVNYHATLSVVDPVGFTATMLPYPAVTPTQIVSLEYDEDRKALLVLMNTATDPVLLRYAFDGANWSAPTQVSIPGLQEIHLSPDGTRILGLICIIPSQQAGIIELDPTSLSQTASTPLPASVATILPTGLPGAWFALANDGNAVVVMYAAVPSVPLVSPVLSEFVYGTSSHVFSVIPVGNTPTPIAPVASGNGNLVEFGFEYNASGGSLDGNVDQNLMLGGAGASFDLAGDKIFQPSEPSLGSLIFTPISGPIAGRLPDTRVGVINRAGTRLYNIENADLTPHLHIFDTSISNGPNSQYPELTPALSLAGDPGVTSQLTPLAAISADGTTVFIAGANGLAVQPVPH